MAVASFDASSLSKLTAQQIATLSGPALAGGRRRPSSPS
jgi:hypothetical protein